MSSLKQKTCILQFIEKMCWCSLNTSSSCLIHIVDVGKILYSLFQVLNESDYQAWAVKHKAAESDMNNRDELVMQSCLTLEKDLELLGRELWILKIFTCCHTFCFALVKFC